MNIISISKLREVIEGKIKDQHKRISEYATYPPEEEFQKVTTYHRQRAALGDLLERNITETDIHFLVKHLQDYGVQFDLEDVKGSSYENYDVFEMLEREIFPEWAKRLDQEIFSFLREYKGPRKDDVYFIDEKFYKVREITSHDQCFLEPVLHFTEGEIVSGGMNTMKTVRELEKRNKVSWEDYINHNNSKAES